MSGQKRLFLPCFLLFITLNLLFANDAAAIKSFASLSAGYDDNPEQLRIAESAAYTATYIDISHQSLYNKGFGESQIYFNLSYTHYDKLGGSIDASLGGHYSFFPFYNRLMLLFFAESGLFRKELTPTDDFDWAAAGARFKYHQSGRLTFDFLQRLRLRSFSEPLAFYTTTTQQGPDGSTEEVSILNKDQRDLLLSSSAGVRADIFKWLYCSIRGEFAHLFSNIEEDVYDKAGALFSIKSSLKDTWQLSIETGSHKKQFKNIDRTDTINRLGIYISRSSAGYELFLDSDYIKNTSSYIEESYKQRLIQCGISLFF